MTSDIDIYRAASVLIREHGDDDALEAAQRADAMLKRGNLEGAAVWKRALRAVEEIQVTDHKFPIAFAGTQLAKARQRY